MDQAAQAATPRLSAALPHWGTTLPTTFGVPGPDPERPGPAGGSAPHIISGHAVSTSPNWAGEIETGSTYTQVAADWVVPAVVPASTTEMAASWIGIDGFENSNLIQTGTSETTSGGSTSYYAWYEILPAASIEIGAVSPGDEMSATIREVSAGVWFLDIADLTSGNSSSGDLNYTGPGTSAEWIQEDPALDFSGDLYPLANFGAATFTNAGFTASNPSSSTIGTVDMVNAAGATVAYVSAFGSGTFTVTFGSPPSSPPTPAPPTPAPPTPAPPTPSPPTPSPPTPAASGYNLVGDDGGVFVFGGGFYGSLPGLGIHVSNIVGMVPSSDKKGYFLVGSDGGVFSFGDTTFEGSLPGRGVHVNDIAGIVPTSDDKGYFLVGRDGGVFAFGDAPFENSLPGIGISVNNIVGIAATASDQGYWLVGSNGSVYAFGNAPSLGPAGPGAVAIAATTDGGGYWVVSADGTVYNFGDARNFASVPDVAVVNNIIGIVPSSDNFGYNIFGSDGGVFSFGDAINLGSLPGLGVHVDNIVGAVPT